MNTFKKGIKELRKECLSSNKRIDQPQLTVDLFLVLQVLEMKSDSLWKISRKD